MWPGKAYHFLSGGDGLEEKVKLYFLFTTAGRRRKRNRKSPRSNSYMNRNKKSTCLVSSSYKSLFEVGGLNRDGL